MLSYSYPPRVKVCGITSVDDAFLAVNAGADAIGCVFYEPSPRSVSIDVACQIVRTVGPMVCPVGLFVNASASFIADVLKQVPLQVLQFHGDEDAAFCDQFQKPYMKAIRMRPGLDLDEVIHAYPNASAILLDAYKKGVPGGTGETFDWARVPETTSQSVPIVLAGGLTPENIQQAILATSPYAVDVSGGVEQSPGKKDPQKISQFIHNVKTV